MPATALVVPGVRTIHQRQAWEDPAWPVTGPAATGVYDDFVGHYPGAGDVPDSDYRGHVYVDPARFRDDLFGYYRQMQQSYAKPKSEGGRGYSVGYLLGIDYLGGLTVLRGFEFRNAANAGSKMPGNWNATSGSAQFVTDLTEPATDQALYTFAMVVAWLRHNGHRARVMRHDDGEYTSCPGAVGAQLSAGLGDPAHWVRVGPPSGCDPLPTYLQPTVDPIEPTDPTPVQEDNDMLFIAQPTFPGATARTSWITYWANPGSAPRGTRTVGAHIEAAKLLGVPIVPMASQEHHAYECALYGIPTTA
jgi:hypothetical protein